MFFVGEGGPGLLEALAVAVVGERRLELTLSGEIEWARSATDYQCNPLPPTAEAMDLPSLLARRFCASSSRIRYLSMPLRSSLASDSVWIVQVVRAVKD